MPEREQTTPSAKGLAGAFRAISVGSLSKITRSRIAPLSAREEMGAISMRKSTVFIAVCAGAPLLALGFGAPTAWADPTTDSGNASVSVSVNGTEKVDKGPGVADSGNVGDHNVAVAINNSVALAGNGDNNHATAINNSLALAGNGDNNRATAINDSFAQAVFGDNNTATAVRGGCARATGGATVRSNGGSC